MGFVRKWTAYWSGSCRRRGIVQLRVVIGRAQLSPTGNAEANWARLLVGSQSMAIGQTYSKYAFFSLFQWQCFKYESHQSQIHKKEEDTAQIVELWRYTKSLIDCVGRPSAVYGKTSSSKSNRRLGTRHHRHGRNSSGETHRDIESSLGDAIKLRCESNELSNNPPFWQCLTLNEALNTQVYLRHKTDFFSYHG